MFGNWDRVWTHVPVHSCLDGSTTKHRIGDFSAHPCRRAREEIKQARAANHSRPASRRPAGSSAAARTSRTSAGPAGASEVSEGYSAWGRGRGRCVSQFVRPLRRPPPKPPPPPTSSKPAFPPHLCYQKLPTPASHHHQAPCALP